MNEKILKLIQKRLQIGERKYGHENVETDDRDFIVEALEEALDCSVYLAAKLIGIQTWEKIIAVNKKREELNESNT